MYGHDPSPLDLDRPRTIPEIFGITASLYGGYLLLVLTIGAIVVVPYEAVFILVAHSVQINSNGRSSTDKVLALAALEFLIVQPLLAALYAHTLAMIGDGEPPRFGEIFRRAFRVLANVVAAEIIAGLLVFCGFLILLVPGVYLLIRLAVVAQAAAIEGLNWPTAVRRGFELTRRNWWRVFGVLLISGLIEVTVSEIAGALMNPGLGVVQVIVGTLASLLTLSFGSLLSAVLYFDLRARHSL